MTLRTMFAISAALAAVLPASATVEFFFTNSASGWGLTDPARAFQPTAGNDLDPATPGIQGDDATWYTAVFPPASVDHSVTPDIDWTAGEFAYLWVRFLNEPLNRKVQGMGLSQPDAAEVAYYIQNDLGNGNGKRWDGNYTLPDAPQFKMRVDQVLAAVTAAGLKNVSNTSYDWDLYDSATRTALLGAVRYSSNGVRSVSLTQGPGWSWIILGFPPDTILPPIGSANWIPEPTTLALICVLTTLRRRNAGRP